MDEDTPKKTKPKKRAARGTFDRKAYMRNYMRKRRGPKLEKFRAGVILAIGGVSL